MSADIFAKIQENRGPLGIHAEESHGYFTFPKLEGEISPHMEFRGTKMLNWSLNNYLGLANDPEVENTMRRLLWENMDFHIQWVRE